MSTPRGYGIRLLCLTTVAAVSFGCRTKSAEDTVRERVLTMARAAEDRKLGTLMEGVSSRFHTADGLSRDELKGLLAAQLFAGRWLRVYPMKLEVRQTSPTQVEVAGTFILGRSRAVAVKDLLRDTSAQSERVDATFEREPDGEWRAVSAAHAPSSL